MGNETERAAVKPPAQPTLVRTQHLNKFQGDAALAVFGAPLRTADPASAALATARALGAELPRLRVDFGIGVSAGPVFAGNIGAENRYEYTVVGDAVNEAARLADRAKDFDGRVLCSGAALDRADAVERRWWSSFGSEVLRGRSRHTHISAPVRSALPHPNRSPHRSHPPHSFFPGFFYSAMGNADV